MSTRKVSPRKAALLAAAVLATSTLSSPALAAVQSMSSVTAAAAVSTVVNRISLPSGPLDGGDVVMISGSGLATGSGTLTPKAVKFGSVTVDPSDVDAVSTGALEVTVPESETAGPVSVVVGDAKKGPVYKYVGEDLEVDTNQGDLSSLAPTTDAGLPDVEIEGTGFEKTTAVLVGGKPAKVTSVTAEKMVVAFPAGLSGIQDVVVSDPRNSAYVGYVTYALAQPTLTAVSSYAVTTAPTTVYLTGTNLNAVTGVTYDTTEKVAFTKSTSPTTLAVTIPKGAAKTSAALKVVTKANKTASTTLTRKAPATPAVTGLTGALAAGGNATLAGTDLVGLKTVTVTPTGGKATTAKVVKVSSDTSATVLLPKLPAGTATVKVNTVAPTASNVYTFTVNSGAATTSAATINAGKNVVTLTGTYLKTATKVVFTPISGSAVEVTGAARLVSNADGTSLAVNLATPLTAGTYGVVATNPAGSSDSRSLTVVATPTVTAVAVDSAKTGITVTGTTLTGITALTFTDADDVATTRSTGFTVDQNGTSVTTTMPSPLAAGTYDVTATTPGGTSTAYSLTVVARPTVSAVAAAANKTDITVTGTVLTGASKVVITPTSGSPIEQASGLTVNGAGTELTFSLSSALTNDTYGVVVTTPGGDSVSSTLTVS